MDSLFHVDGKPFFSIGGQLNNSTSSDPALTEKAFKTCVGLGLNTVAAPVHWELFEKEEGAYDFAQIDMLMELARRSGLRLVVLWFGTWKNGNSHYVPEWVKLQKERFLWAKANDGAEIRVLSPTCEETKKADMRAFCELCGHIARNNADGCVIGIQIENEPGLIGAARDYSPQSTKLFKGRIPADAAEFIGADGTWEETFGFYAAEFFTAYHIAHYIDDIAEAGKRVLDLPMYINVWLGEMYAHIPGTNYPSGGAVTKTFRFWKHLLKHVDAIAPDIYVSDYREVEELFRTYSGEGNIFHLPESSPMPLSMTNSMRAVAEYGLTGVHTFGIDILSAAADRAALCTMAASGAEGAKKSALLREIADSYTILRHSKHLIEKYQGTGRLYAVAQYEGAANQVFDFGSYIGEIEFLNMESAPINGGNVRRMDNRHMASSYDGYRAKGFIVDAGNGEFYLTGDAYKLRLYPKFSLEELTSAVHAGDFLNTRSQGYLSVTEGEFTADGEYKVNIIRNGDEYDYGLWVTSDIGVLRVRMDR